MTLGPFILVKSACQKTQLGQLSVMALSTTLPHKRCWVCYFFFQIGFLFTLYNSFTKNYFIHRARLCIFTKRAIYIHIQNFINLHNVKHRYSQWFPISNIWWITKFPTSTTLPEYTSIYLSIALSRIPLHENNDYKFITFLGIYRPS